MGTGHVIGLEAGGNVTLGANQIIGDANTRAVSIEAGMNGSGTIIDSTGAPAGSAVILTTSNADLNNGGGYVVLTSHNNANNLPSTGTLTVTTPNLAIYTDGDLNLYDTISYNVTTLNAICSGTQVNGIHAGNALNLVKQTGDIVVLSDVYACGNVYVVAPGGSIILNGGNITSCAGNVGMYALNNIDLNANTVNAAGTASLVAHTGAITDTTGSITATSVVLSASSAVGSCANPILISATNLAAETTSSSAAPGGVYVRNTSTSLTVRSLSTVDTSGYYGEASRSVGSISAAAGDVWLQTTGALILNAAPVASGSNTSIAMQAGGNITLNQAFGTVTNHDVELVAGAAGSGTIIDGRSSPAPGSAVITAGHGISLQSNGNGQNITLTVNAPSLAALAGGSLTLTDTQGFTVTDNTTLAAICGIGGVATGAVATNAVTLTATTGNISVATAVQGGGATQVVASNGDISTTATITSTGSTVTVQASGDVTTGAAVTGSGTVALNAQGGDISVGGNVTSTNGNVLAVAPSGTITLQGNGTTTLSNVSAAQGSVGMYAHGAISLGASNVTANATGTASFVSLADTVTETTGLVTAGTVVLQTATGVGSPLEVSTTHLSGSVGSGSAAIDNQGTGLTIGRYAVVDTSAYAGSSGYVTSSGVGLTAPGDVCVHTTGALVVAADVTAGGSVALVSADVSSNVNNTITLNGGDVTATTGSVALYANGYIDLRANDLTGHTKVSVVSTNDSIGDNGGVISAPSVVLSAQGSIGSTGTGVLQLATPVGSATMNLAAQSTGAFGVIYLQNAGSLTIDQVSTVDTSGCGGAASQTVTGVHAPTLVGIAASGDLTVNQPVTCGGDILLVSTGGAITLTGGDVNGNAVNSTGGNVGLYASGRIAMGGFNIRAGSTSGNRTASFTSVNDTVTQTTGQIYGYNVVFDTRYSPGYDLGTLGPVNINATVLALLSRGGAIHVNNSTGALTIGSVSVVDTGSWFNGGLAHPTISGVDNTNGGTSTDAATPVHVYSSGNLTVAGNVNGSGPVYVVAPYGSITLNGGYVRSTGDNVALYANGNISLGSYNVTATNGAVSIVSATGGIFDGTGVVTGLSVAMCGETGIGTGSNVIHLVTPTIAAISPTGGVYVCNMAGTTTVSGALTIGQLSSIDTTADGGAAAQTFTGVTSTAVTAANVIVGTSGNLTVNNVVSGPGTVELISSGGTITLSSADVSATTSSGSVGLYASGNISLGANSITAGSGTGTASLVSANGAITDNGGTVSGSQVALSAYNDIGASAAASRLLLNTPTVAASSSHGAVYLSATGALDVSAVNTLSTITCGGASSATITGISAANGIGLTTSGNLTVSSNVAGGGNVIITAPSTGATITLTGGNVSSSGGDVAIYAAGSIGIGSNNVSASMTSPHEASIVSGSGAITGTTGRVSGYTVALIAPTGVGGATPLLINTAVVGAISTGAGVNLSNSSSALSLNNVNTLDTSGWGGVTAAPIAGVSSTVDSVCVATAGALSVDVAPTVGNGADIGLEAGGSITLQSGQTLGSANVHDVVLEAGMTGRNGSYSYGTGTIVNNTGTTTTAVITAAHAIGLQIHGVTTLALNVSAPNLAAYGEGSVSLVDSLSTGFAVYTMNGLCSGQAINGIASRDGSVALYSPGTIALGPKSISANRTTGTVSLASGSTITETTGTVTGNRVVLQTVNSLGASGSDFVIDASQLAAQSTSGSIYIKDTGNGVNIGQYSLVDTTAIGGVSGTLTGVSATTAGQDVSVRGTGSMVVAANVTSGGDVSLVSSTGTPSASNTITLNGGSVTAASGTGNVALYANGSIAISGANNINAGMTSGEASLVSSGGAITDAGGGTVYARTIALVAPGGIGTGAKPLLTDPATVTVGALSTSGSVYISNTGDLVVGTVSTLDSSASGGAAAQQIAGITSTTADVCVSTTGNLTVNNDITAGGNATVVSSGGSVTMSGGDVTSTSTSGNVAIHANGTIALNNNNVTAGATSGTVSLVSVTDTVTEGTGLISGNRLVMRTYTSAGAPGTPLNLAVGQLAATSSTGSLVLNSERSGLTIGTYSTLDTSGCGGATASSSVGLSAANGDICLEITGNLIVASNVTAGGNVILTAPSGTITLGGGNVSANATNGHAALYASGNISLGTNSLNAGTTSGEASAVSLNGAITDGSGGINGYTAVLLASTGIGTALNPIKLAVSNTAAASATGGVYLSNTGALTVGTYSTLDTSGCGGATAQQITGIGSATSGNVCVVTTGAMTLTSAPTVASGYDLGLEAGGNITIGSGQTLGSGNAHNVSLNAGTGGTGTIIDNSATSVGNPVITAGNGIALITHGTSPASNLTLTVSAPNLAVSSAGALTLTETQTFNVTTLNTLCSNTPVTGVSAVGNLGLTTTNGNITVLNNVSSSGGNVTITAPSTGATITLNGGNVVASSGNVAIYASGTVALGGNNVTASTSSGEVSLVSATGAITDGAGRVTGHTVALSGATGVGTSAQAILITTPALSVLSSGGGVYINNTGALDINTISTLSTAALGGVGAATLTGVSSSADLCIRTSGALTVSSDVIAGGNATLVSTGGNLSLTGGNVSAGTGSGSAALYASGNIAIGSGNINAGTTSGEASLVAGGAITDGTGVVTANQVALSGASGVGTSGNAITLATATLAARSASGAVYLSNTGALTVSTVSTLDTSACGGAAASQLTGLSASGALCATTTGNLTVSNLITASGNVAVTSSGGTLTLNGANVTTSGATSDVALYASGTISLGSGNVTAGATSGEASLVSANGSITDNGGTVSGKSVALSGSTGVGTAGNAVKLSTSTLAASSATGGVFVSGTGALDVNTVNTISTLGCGGAAAATLTGVSASTTACVTTTGALTVSNDITGGGDVYVTSSGSTVSLTGGNVSTTGATSNVALYASGALSLGSNNVTAGGTSGTASLVSANGAITDGTGVVNGNQVVLSASNAVGSAGAPVLLGSTTVAARSVNGGVFVKGTGALGIGAVYTISTLGCGGEAARLVSGLQSGNASDLCLVNAGALTLGADLSSAGDVYVVSTGGAITLSGGATISSSSATGNVALYANGNISLGSGNISAGANGTASIVSANGSITDGTGVVSGGKVALSGATGVGASGSAITLSTSTVAASSTAGGVFVSNTGGLAVSSVDTVSTLGCGGAAATTLTGVSASTTACVTTTGALTVSQDVTAGGDVYVISSGSTLTLNGADVKTTSATGNVALYANGSISLGTSNVTAGATSGEASLVSANGAISDGTGVVSGAKVALSGATGVGTAVNAIKLSTPRMAASSATGGVFVSTTGALDVSTVNTLSTLGCGGAAAATLTGVNASTTACVTTAGALTVSSDVRAGGDVYVTSSGSTVSLTGGNISTTSATSNVALYASGNLSLGSGNVTAGATSGTASLVSASGAITDGTGVVSGAKVALSGATGVGTALNPVNLVAPALAATSSGDIFLSDSVASVTLGSVSTVSTAGCGGAAATALNGIVGGGDLVFATSNLLTVGKPITGPGRVCLVSHGGGITLTGGGVSGYDVVFFASGDINLGGYDLTANGTNGTLSVISTGGSLIDNGGTLRGYRAALCGIGIGASGTGHALLLDVREIGSLSFTSGSYFSQTGSLTVTAVSSIDTSSFGGGGVSTFHGMRSTASTVALCLSGDLTVTDSTYGINAGTDVTLVAPTGGLTLNGGGITAAGNVALHARDTIALGVNDVTAGTAGEVSLVSASGSITDNGGTVRGASVALRASGGIGSIAAPINVASTNANPVVLAAQSLSGGVVVSNTGLVG
ncbi:MAG: S-layer family protein, partial [Proteobacteria bacterium]|nr:S-layer family protein [Pseudomonadota bacterium]